MSTLKRLDAGLDCFFNGLYQTEKLIEKQFSNRVSKGYPES
jgi:hypothetical protein